MAIYIRISARSNSTVSGGSSQIRGWGVCVWVRRGGGEVRLIGHITFVDIDHKIISAVILLIQEKQLSAV